MSLAQQYTLAQAISQSGVGLHSGEITTVKILPATRGGRHFVRVDLPECPIITASCESVRSTTLSTELGNSDSASIRTVEHLLSALTAGGVSHARIEVNGPELPLLDGSAKPWSEAIAAAGLKEIEPQPIVAPLNQEISVRQGDAFVMAIPSTETRFTYGIDFEVAPIGNQWHSWSPDEQNFITEIAPARTFTLASQIEALQKAGLIKGGSLDNAIVCSHSGWINPPLRFANEPARHKILDLVGDLSLLGTIPLAHYLAYKAGHHLHVELVRRISQTPTNSNV
ncbi:MULTISPECIES: UDP-3-O-acyl-N-acetylglucosamine deacetylase [Arthrospira]|jgi:UDP-3-O-[3-hydroxymyristoyl] N-acetylglucosamine deacetylase|uniref:UDP-3-O-acyl-N-acetylglucosamine deacetylase n=1 Tax=Limnospira platensis NIES-46 TaxID=1236695 RepID=A0A5M3T2Z9_LIMPL|nr:UDP-3-O-acyl-N-acetylglucosamine deacetylase [Arthrospira platensis]AMW30044.1 UDP-3-O-[3-hydroxymyristoyl] N-acetylglucosamine deacetylase [Arthrospira platensis YZ]KDR53981.1 UDP-3-O-(3-hydroxymyristoyl) glucosamine N-acyltransferase [Arthrospira platensis str. Paraca]MBD2671366.1 UDP-3-O-acyl-N-acetylglucosamine deacetylase [Arthrospira platensis FACHB-439]MBD2712293.1 UDP-3-O-acyl-N-acetylglucosamine deacetylase [Arthrospira platensis FACHB-835]MDF2211888.1 UDP-3-O-acyl-N-acetylglucosam